MGKTCKEHAQSMWKSIVSNVLPYPIAVVFVVLIIAMMALFLLIIWFGICYGVANSSSTGHREKALAQGFLDKVHNWFVESSPGPDKSLIETK